jgi:hypothetical protein
MDFNRFFKAQLVETKYFCNFDTQEHFRNQNSENFKIKTLSYGVMVALQFLDLPV